MFSEEEVVGKGLLERWVGARSRTPEVDTGVVGEQVPVVGRELGGETRDDNGSDRRNRKVDREVA